ncbi:MAG: SEC-C domain-containing protein [Ottowia sp.]|nr:SEC-C domain-containing protein [Ottowia sp.]
MISTPIICPCNSQKQYANCCGIYHQGLAAPSADLLMPSRYSAYVLEINTYLLKTWHPSTRPKQISFDKNLKWLGLDIKNAKIIDQKNATVEFIVHYTVSGKTHQRHEISSFVFEDDGCWYYVDGIFPK